MLFVLFATKFLEKVVGCKQREMWAEQTKLFFSLFATQSTQMSSNDCFEMGRQSYINMDFYHTALWMREAMARLTNDGGNHTTSTSRADILEYLAFSIYKQGKSK